MKKPFRLGTLFVVLIIHYLPASAELPSITDGKWNGHFAIMEKDDFVFGLTTRSQGHIHPLNKDGKMIHAGNPITLGFQIFKTQPGSEPAKSKIAYDQLTSAGKPVINSEEPIAFQGKIENGPSYTVKITPERDGISATGKITDKAESKSPVTFGIDLKFDPYRRVKLDTKQEIDEFEKLTKKDEIRVISKTGKKGKFDIDEEVNLVEQFPDGVSEIKLELAKYGGLEFEITASEGSRINFMKNSSGPVYQALTFFWTVDTGSDPDKETLTVIGK